MKTTYSEKSQKWTLELSDTEFQILVALTHAARNTVEYKDGQAECNYENFRLHLSNEESEILHQIDF